MTAQGPAQRRILGNERHIDNLMAAPHCLHLAACVIRATHDPE
ncbi:MAG: hypothetical protein R2844_12300 [Caldilineales bacterium]